MSMADKERLATARQGLDRKTRKKCPQAEGLFYSLPGLTGVSPTFSEEPQKYKYIGLVQAMCPSSWVIFT